MKTEDTSQRWENYRLANNSKPSTRERELKEIFTILSPEANEKILEVGTGNGYLTFPIANAVGENGLVVTADVVRTNLDAVTSQPRNNLNIEALLFDPEKDQVFPNEFTSRFDAVASIATLHHFDNRTEATGTAGREKVLKEFYRVLKTGGRLVIGDPINDSITQKYFDRVDNPMHCYPDGHPHNFFSIEELKELVERVGFKNIAIEIKRVPWKFTSPEEAKTFVHTIHNAKCTPEESFNLAKEVLGFEKIDDHYELGWELFFLKAIK